MAAANPKARHRPPRTGAGGAIPGLHLRRLLPFLSFLLLPLAVPAPLALAADPLSAQPAEVAVDRENLRREPAPDGRRLAVVNGGTRIEIAGSRGRWREVVLSGWIWTPSVSVTSRSGFDLVVSADGGENLRTEPSGEARIAARLLEGFLLEELEGRGNWTRVRRAAWMWAPSLRVRDGGAGADTPTGGDGAAAGATEPGGDGGAGGDGGGTGLDDLLVVEGESARLLRSPRSDTLAVLRPGADLSVLERRGEWTRVRMEGWVRSEDVASPDSPRPDPELTPADLRANPERYQGRRVRWTVQFVSLERAEPVRTDFYEGEPFVLARPGPNASGFVYLAVPSELLPRVEELRPLERIRVTGRVRTGRSALMGAPILDLLEFARGEAR